MRRSLLALAVSVLLASPAAAQITPYAAGPTGQSSLALIAPTAALTDNGNRIATTAWVNLWAASAMPLASGKIWIGSVGNVATPQTPSGDLTVSNAGVFTFGTVNGNVGSFGSATLCPTVTVNAKGLITAASAATCTPAVGNITGLGTGVPAALAIAVGSAGAPVVFNGAGGTPSSMVATNVTALNATQLTTGTMPAARLGLSQITASLGANVALNNTGTYFDGPSIAQGATGIWWASGTATVTDTAGAANVDCKLWDGTTVIDSARASISAINLLVAVSLSGFLATPAGNIRISCKDIGSTSGSIIFNATGNSKDSTVSAFRVN